MVTEAQRKAFLDALNTICNTSVLISKKHAKYDRWLKNFYYRYNNNTMPEEHIQMFKSRLNNYHITFEEFLETKGNLKVFVQLCTERKNSAKTNKKPNLARANKIIQELLNQNNEKDKKISSLEDQISKYEEESKKKDTIELIDNQKNYKELQKNYLMKLLVEEDNISLEKIKSKLEKAGIPLIGLEGSLSELRNEVPGIIRSISNDGLNKVYSICGTATNRQEALRNSEICPRISDILDGTIQFLVLSDIHLPLDSTMDQIKTKIHPLLECSCRNGNIPIIDLGDTNDSNRKCYFEWINKDKRLVDLSYNFYKTYASVISENNDTNYHLLLGNHDGHHYELGVDPVEIINDYSDNIKVLGIDKGSIMIGNDKIGLYHTIGNQCRPTIESKYKNICEELYTYANDYIYSLIGHYHVGIHDPINHFSAINNGFNKALLFTAEIENGTVKRMSVDSLYITNNNKMYRNNSYRTEIYNSDHQLKKKKSQ